MIVKFNNTMFKKDMKNIITSIVSIHPKREMK